MNKQALYNFATDNTMSLDSRYAAARELQNRRFTDDMILPLVKLFPHMDVADIAKELNVGLKRRLGHVL